MSQKIEQGYYKRLHWWVVGIKHLTKTFDLQLESYENLLYLSKNLKWKMQSSIFRSVIPNEAPCLFPIKTGQSERQIFLFFAEEFEGSSSR